MVAQETVAAYERRLNYAKVPPAHRPHYHKWVRFYLDFCHKFGHPPRSRDSLEPFLAKLAAKGQPSDQRQQAAAAVALLIRPAAKAAVVPTPKPAGATLSPAELPPPANPATPTRPTPPGPPATHPPSPLTGASWQIDYHQLEAAIKMRIYSRKTFEAYRFWMAKFQAFVRSRPTGELGTDEVRAFLSDLAVRHGVAASTQNQAFNALLFFYRHVLRREFGQLDGVVRAKRHRYIPVVLSRPEVEAVLAALQPPYHLAVLLLYGCGLRLAECVNLRVQCFNLDSMLLTVHDGKGQKDRTVPLPARALPQIRQQLDFVRRLHAQDLAADYAGVFLPRQLDKKYKNAAKEFIWQWFLPAPTLTFLPDLREHRRYHIHESHVQAAVKQAAATAAITKRVSPHTFRHTFASHLLLANFDLQTIQRLLGHSDIKTTMIYLQTVPSHTLKQAKSPLDCPGPGSA